jgi:hypothetical protein
MADRDFAEEFTRLAERFDVVACRGESDRELLHVAAAAGVVAVELGKAGVVPEIPRPDLSSDRTWQLSQWELCWLALVAMLEKSSALTQPNPLAINWHPVVHPHPGHPMEVHGGTTSRADWRLRASSFASVCRDLVRELGESTGTPESKTEPGKKLPQNTKVHKFAIYYKSQRQKLNKSGVPLPPRKTLVAAFLETTDETEIDSFDKNFQPSKYGWLLD